MDGELTAPGLKLCPRCDTLKSRFPLSNRTATRHGVKTYLKTHCTDCQARQTRVTSHLRKIYTPPPPGSPCECCGRSSPSLLLDHDHLTGAFRGWLCRNCNSGLGVLRDNAEGVRAAMVYLNP